MLVCGLLVGSGAHGWAKEKPKEKCTVAALAAELNAGGESDSALAARLDGLELTERMSAGVREKLTAALPGEKSRQALTMLADAASFLEPPDAEIDALSTPDAAATRQMLERVVGYVNTTLRQLPNFLVTKQTARFEDRPAGTELQATGLVSFSAQPMHWIGQSSLTLTYRDHHEVIDEHWTRVLAQTGAGLATSGEFGGVLITVVADALKGHITWARWEKSVGGDRAVFHYEVPEERSNYRVKFCCVVDGYAADGTPQQVLFDERAKYQGEIAFDPKDGTIWWMTLNAELPPRELVPAAAMLVEYAPVEIGGRSYMCPRHSVSRLVAHTAQQSNTQSRSNYQGPLKTFLNDVEFSGYKRFGSEMRIVPGGA